MAAYRRHKMKTTGLFALLSAQYFPLGLLSDNATFPDVLSVDTSKGTVHSLFLNPHLCQKPKITCHGAFQLPTEAPNQGAPPISCPLCSAGVLEMARND